MSLSDREYLCSLGSMASPGRGMLQSGLLKFDPSSGGVRPEGGSSTFEMRPPSGQTPFSPLDFITPSFESYGFDEDTHQCRLFDRMNRCFLDDFVMPRGYRPVSERYCVWDLPSYKVEEGGVREYQSAGLVHDSSPYLADRQGFRLAWSVAGAERVLLEFDHQGRQSVELHDLEARRLLWKLDLKSGQSLMNTPRDLLAVGSPEDATLYSLDDGARIWEGPKIVSGTFERWERGVVIHSTRTSGLLIVDLEDGTSSDFDLAGLCEGARGAGHIGLTVSSWEVLLYFEVTFELLVVDLRERRVTHTFRIPPGSLTPLPEPGSRRRLASPPRLVRVDGGFAANISHANIAGSFQGYARWDTVRILDEARLAAGEECFASSPWSAEALLDGRVTRERDGPSLFGYRIDLGGFESFAETYRAASTMSRVVATARGRDVLTDRNDAFDTEFGGQIVLDFSGATLSPEQRSELKLLQVYVQDCLWAYFRAGSNPHDRIRINVDGA